MRGNMLIFSYQLRHVSMGKQRTDNYIKAVKPDLERYTALVRQIKGKSKERRTLLNEKKETPTINVLRHRGLSRQIAGITEELEDLKSEQELALRTLDCADDAAVSAMKADVSTMEDGLKKLDEQEVRCAAELDRALQEYADLMYQAVEMDAIELMDARLALRPEKEQNAISRIQTAYGEKYDPQMMTDSKRDVATLLGEEQEEPSIRDRLRKMSRELLAQKAKRQKRSNERGWER